jgi:hypothetical protein
MEIKIIPLLDPHAHHNNGILTSLTRVINNLELSFKNTFFWWPKK